MQRTTTTPVQDVAFLALRVTAGGLLAGHGAQKLFGAFGGYGLAGTAGWLETLGLRPGKAWALLAGGSEFGSGMLTALGFLDPVGPICIWGPMVVAWHKAHRGNPIWAQTGGAELPLVYSVIGAALALTGPGRYSLDHALGIKLPKALIGLTIAGVAGGVAAAMTARPAPNPQQTDEAGAELQGGQEASQSAFSQAGTSDDTREVGA